MPPFGGSRLVPVGGGLEEDPGHAVGTIRLGVPPEELEEASGEGVVVMDGCKTFKLLPPLDVTPLLSTLKANPDTQ